MAANPNSDRDVIYALRTTHQYQTNLVNLADQKANILIGLSLVSYTIVFTRASWVLEQAGFLKLMILLFLGTQLATVLCAVWVILPKLTPYQKPESLDASPNPMFFGFFTHFPQKEFIENTMNTIKCDDSSRYSLLRDIYQIGNVLNRKYKVLRAAYLMECCSLALLFIGTLAYLLGT